VVGALATAELARRYDGAEPVLGGLAWERRPIDPVPGPRGTEEIVAVDLDDFRHTLGRQHDAAARGARERGWRVGEGGARDGSERALFADLAASSEFDPRAHFKEHTHAG